PAAARRQVRQNRNIGFVPGARRPLSYGWGSCAARMLPAACVPADTATPDRSHHRKPRMLTLSCPLTAEYHTPLRAGLPHRRTVGNERLHALAPIDARDLPIPAGLLQVHGLRLISVLVNVLHPYPGFALADRLRFGHRDAFDRRAGFLQVSAE